MSGVGAPPPRPSMSGRKCRRPTAQPGSIIILAHICSGLDLLEKPARSPPRPRGRSNSETANFAQFIKLSYRGAISESERNIAARDRVCNTRSIHRARTSAAHPSSSRPTPPAQLTTYRYLANNAVSGFAGTRCPASRRRRALPHDRDYRAPSVIPIFIGDAHKYAGQVISLYQMNGRASHVEGRPPRLTRKRLHETWRGRHPVSPSFIIKKQKNAGALSLLAAVRLSYERNAVLIGIF
ncbi:unnamed protein product [Leptosia nina]|uniref:Uncharacterized protein n=1 Tax=Leptosia nina TaxID=320188 RepID=A0AAV1JM00_9NEOP